MERYRLTLSAGRHELRFRVADDIDAVELMGLRAVVTLRAALHNYTYPDVFHLSVNGTCLDESQRTVPRGAGRTS